MRIELILLGLILLVIAIDFFVKKRKKSSSEEIVKFEESKNNTLKKPVILKWFLISLVLISLGSLVVYQFIFAPKIYKTSEVTFNNNLTYLKNDMSLLNGKINYSLYSRLFINEGLFVNGKKEGFHRIKYNYYAFNQHHIEYKSSGNMYTIENKAKGEFIDNKYNGEWTFYHHFGKVYAKGTFKNQDTIGFSAFGVPNTGREGLWRFWHENGQLVSEKNYVNGKEEGLSRYWNKNGQLREEKNYVNGKEEGLSRYWNKNGQSYNEKNYVNGKLEGLSRYWHENGQLSVKMTYVNGKQQRKNPRSWDENGKRQKELSYDQLLEIYQVYWRSREKK